MSVSCEEIFGNFAKFLGNDDVKRKPTAKKNLAKRFLKVKANRFDSLHSAHFIQQHAAFSYSVPSNFGFSELYADQSPFFDHEQSSHTHDDHLSLLWFGHNTEGDLSHAYALGLHN